MRENVLAVFLLSMSLCACAEGDTSRGVRVVQEPRRTGEPPGPFDPGQSAALFVGVRDFAQTNLGPMQYSVDDAVDLAYVMAFDRKVRLVPPDRIVLALSNEPVKDESRQRLRRLVAKGAAVAGADRETISAQLERQTGRAGANGLMILFVASHGFSSDGTPYVLASNSLFDDTASSLSAAKMFDLAAASPARRSMVFIDACRERIPAGRRAAYYRTGSTAPMIETMSRLDGQVIFYAAAPGGWAYEDPQVQNGVFTHAIIESLTRCDADKSAGMINAETLGRHIEKRVRDWIRRHRDRTVRTATQSLMDPFTKAMPIAVCTPPPKPRHYRIADSAITVLDDSDRELWSGNAGAPITVARIIDLDDDQLGEVVVGDASGTLTVFTADGVTAWSQKTAVAMPITELTIDYLFAKKDKRHIVALSNAPDGGESLLSVFTADGTLNASHHHEGRLLNAVIDRLTARHAAKIIVTGTSSVFMLDRKGERVWHAGLFPQPQSIRNLRTVDIDNDRRLDIEIQTTAGTVYLTFDGNTIKTDGPIVSK